MDIYALGAILYRLLGGRPPFQAATALDTVMQVVNEDAVPLRRLNQHVPRDLETICQKCLQKDPRKRYAMAEGLAEDLRRWQAGEPITARPVGPVERALEVDAPPSGQGSFSNRAIGRHLDFLRASGPGYRERAPCPPQRSQYQRGPQGSGAGQHRSESQE